MRYRDIYNRDVYIVFMLAWGDLLVRVLPVRFALRLGVILVLALWFGASSAEKLVNPDVVAPQYRAVAEQRRAEQIKLFVCSKKADEAKVLRRDRAAFIGECLDK
jgi:hypothetical protein